MHNKRLAPTPRQSSLIFGPRGVGKSTWLKSLFPKEPYFDLLDTAAALQYAKDPAQFYREVKAFSPKQWILVDEIQKVPQLLDQVHRLMEESRYKFLLSGSSARKLKRGSANLLAGRALTQNLLPFVSAELASTNIDTILRFGLLPMAALGDQPAAYLKSYALTYLKQEIQDEALTRNVGAFSRFLEVAARQSGQITNLSNIARDAEVKRPTVTTYFDILVDTLIGTWLPAWSLKGTTKQTSHPKFYLFDTGVQRALANRLAYDISPEEKGILLETWLLHEVRAYLEYSRLDYPLFYWSSYDRVEVDLLFETQKGFVAIEIKSSAQWRPQFARGFARLREDKRIKNLKAYCVFLGDKTQVDNKTTIYPAKVFLEKLWAGELF